MPKLIAIDPGHGPETPGKRTPLMPDGKQIQEYQFNVPTARFLAAALQRCGFTTLLTATGDKDVPLGQRVGAANAAKADAFVSIHYNAFRGSWDETEGGVETHHYPGSTMGQQLANLVQKQVAQGTSQVNRGVQASNFYVLRETDMPAILVENGFMDVRREADLMLKPEFQKEQAEQIAQGLCQFFGVGYVAGGAVPSDNQAAQIEELKRQLAEVQARADAAEQAAGAMRQQLAQYRAYFKMQRELQELP